MKSTSTRLVGDGGGVEPSGTPPDEDEDEDEDEEEEPPEDEEEEDEEEEDAERPPSLPVAAVVPPHAAAMQGEVARARRRKELRMTRLYARAAPVPFGSAVRVTRRGRPHAGTHLAMPPGMVATVRRKLVTVIASSELQDRLEQDLLRYGAHGYSVSKVDGRGRHGPRTRGIFDIGNVRIESLVTPEVADVLLEHLSKEAHIRRLVVFVQDVETLSGEQVA